MHVPDSHPESRRKKAHFYLNMDHRMARWHGICLIQPYSSSSSSSLCPKKWWKPQPRGAWPWAKFDRMLRRLDGGLVQLSAGLLCAPAIQRLGARVVSPSHSPLPTPCDSIPLLDEHRRWPKEQTSLPSDTSGVYRHLRQCLLGAWACGPQTPCGNRRSMWCVGPQ